MPSVHARAASVAHARATGPAGLRSRVVARAEDGFCRDKISDRKEVQGTGKTYKVTFLAGEGDSRTVDCPDNTYILDIAEENGIELPATCRGGICGACVGRLASGGVDQSDIDDLSFVLTEEEQAQGMTLLCMARPTSDCEIETQCDWGYSLGVKEWEGATGKFEGTVDPLMGKQWDDNAKFKKEA
ncbi:unnamed protein product [Pedinophyceae sp. YPF-701]|nr:unnamed protein product [Pedinophyceae sp. YPF-701]